METKKVIAINNILVLDINIKYWELFSDFNFSLIFISNNLLGFNFGFGYINKNVGLLPYS